MRTYASAAYEFCRKHQQKVVELGMRTMGVSVAERARRARFKRLVEQSLRTLPGTLRERLDNVDIVVEDEPSEEQRRTHGDDEGELFGLYEGTPQSERGSSYNMVVPDRIVIFRGPLERTFEEPKKIAEEVRITVLHELAHHFGFDEDRIAELGLA